MMVRPPAPKHKAKAAEDTAHLDKPKGPQLKKMSTDKKKRSKKITKKKKKKPKMTKFDQTEKDRRGDHRCLMLCVGCPNPRINFLACTSKVYPKKVYDSAFGFDHPSYYDERDKDPKKSSDCCFLFAGCCLCGIYCCLCGNALKEAYESCCNCMNSCLKDQGSQACCIVSLKICCCLAEGMARSGR